MSAFSSRRLTGALLEQADLVLTVEATHRTFILDDHPGLFRKVFTLGQFAPRSSSVPRGLDRDALLAQSPRRRGNADPALDVRTPIAGATKPPQAAWRASEELLRAVLPALTT